MSYQSTSCLRSLVNLQLSANQLTGLASVQLQRLPNLEQLDIQDNAVKYLDFDVFIFNPKIKVSRPRRTVF